MAKAIFLSHQGLVRENNEDAYSSVGDGFFVLCDGLGGHAAGEVAAALAVRTTLKSWEKNKKHDPAPRIREAIAAANRAIFEEASRDLDKRGMGTTIVALGFGDHGVAVGWVGDSRAYRFDKEEFEPLTTDHRVGLTMLANALGISPEPFIEIKSLPKKKDDRFLLATDGLTDVVPQETIARLALTLKSPKTLAKSLIDETLQRGAPDNVTVGVITQ